jgi:alpha-ribazole phosphatase
MREFGIALRVMRHARSVIGCCYGQSDVPVELSAQAAAECVLASSGADLRSIDVIWASPWQRTLGVAQALGVLMQRPVRVDARLSELNFGKWECRDWEEIHRDDRSALMHWADDPMRRAPPGGECGFELVARVGEWLAEIEAQRDLAASVLAITHAGPIRALRALVAQHAAHEMRRSCADGTASPEQPCGHIWPDAPQALCLQLDFEQPVEHLRVSLL